MCVRPELSEDWLYEQYIIQSRDRNAIAKDAGVTPTKVGTLLQKYNIKRYTVTRHGLYKHPLNAIWYGIKERCLNPNSCNYKWYGAKGITICEDWLNFITFYNWAIDNGWEPGLTVDRICGDGEYSPSNCRIISMKQQCRNRTSNVLIEIDGERHLQCEWEELLELRPRAIAKWKHLHGIDYAIRKLKDKMGVKNVIKDNRG